MKCYTRYLSYLVFIIINIFTFPDILASCENDYEFRDSVNLGLEYIGISDDDNEVLEEYETADINITAFNKGNLASSEAIVSLTCNSDNPDNIELNDTLINLGQINPGDSINVSFGISITGFLEQNFNLELYFILSAGADTVELIKNLTVYNSGSYYSMDFESTIDYSTDLFPWTSVDGDNLQSYQSADCDFPLEGEAFGFMAFNPDDAGFYLASPHGGERCGMSMSPYAGEGRSNDWLISPKINMPGVHTISFWVLTPKPGTWGLESYNVRVSTTDKDTSSFTHIIALEEEVPDEWAYRSYSISSFHSYEYIYIAIQCVSFDKLMFWIDDIDIYGG